MILFLSVCLFRLYPDVSPDTDTGGPGISVRYVLTVVDPSKHEAAVTMTIEDNTHETIRFIMDGLIRIDGVAAAAGSGKKLRVEKTGAECTVHAGKSTTIVLSYGLLMNQYHDRPVRGPRGYLCGEYMLTRVPWVFPEPQVPVKGVSVSFKLPLGWRAVTPWERAAQADGNTSVYIERDWLKFREDTFAAGAFDVRTVHITGTDVTIAADTRFGAVHREKLFRQCASVYTYMKGLFGAAGPEKHLSVFAAPTGPDEWQSLNESGLSQGEAVAGLSDACYQFAHRVFHTYNAFYPEGMSIEPTWFLEGTNEYYDAVAGMKARVEAPFASLAGVYKTVYIPGVRQYDAPLSGNTRDGGNWDRERFLAYVKGALVSFLLDREIRGATKGKQSLDGLIAALYAAHGRFRQGVVTDKTIEEAASALCGKDMEGFFEEYIRSKKRLDMDADFSDTDGDGIVNAGEAALGTDPDSIDSDGDGASDLYEFFHETDPLDKRSRPPGTIHADGFDLEWDKAGGDVITEKDHKGDAKGKPDIASVTYIRCKEGVYLKTAFTGGPVKDSAHRYFANIDLGADGSYELQVAAVYGTPGDTSRFGENWQSYDFKSMELVEGLESGTGGCVEIALPVSMFEGAKRVRFACGAYDTSGGGMVDEVTPFEVVLGE